MLDIEITVFWDVTSCSIIDISLSATPVASASHPEEFQVVSRIAGKYVSISAAPNLGATQYASVYSPSY
jgi:hypothetical protein